MIISSPRYLPRRAGPKPGGRHRAAWAAPAAPGAPDRPVTNPHTPRGPVLHGVMADHVARAEVVVDAGQDAVWAALTDPAAVAEWMLGAEVSTDWQVGSPITWRGELDGRAYEDKGEVLAVDPPNRLSVTHYSPLLGQADAPENYHTIVYELSGGDGPTTLSLTQDGNDSAEQAAQFSTTWQHMLDALKGTVERG